jgi:putative transposase
MWRFIGMSKQRRRHGAQFKFEIAMEAAKELKTIQQLASEHGIHPNQIGQWKRQLLDQGAAVFANGSSDQQKKQEAVQSQLFEQIGRLKMEIEWLKKKFN